MANIYAVYRAAKLVLFRKGLVRCDIFRETFLYLRVKILKEVGRFSETLLILLEIQFFWNNGGQKHSLSIRLVFSLLYRIDELAACIIPIIFISYL